MNRILHPGLAGYDHDIFSFRKATEPRGWSLPEDARIGICLTIVLQHFPISEKPAYPVPGMLARPWPDIGSATQRRVGLHEGLWRMLDALEARGGLPVNFVIEADALPMLDELRPQITAPQNCIFAGGRNAALLHGPHLAEAEEAAVIAGVATELSDFAGRPVTGWRSPSNAQSPATLRLLAEAGFTACGDFNNDDRAYPLHAAGHALWSVPMPHTVSDLHNIEVSRQSAAHYFEAFSAGAGWLAASQEPGPVIIPIVLHPWITGTPHRIGAFEAALDSLMARGDTRFVTAADLVAGEMAATSTARDM